MSFSVLPSEIESCFDKNSTLVGGYSSISDIMWFIELNSVCKKLGVGSEIRNSVHQRHKEIEHFVKELKLSSEPWKTIKLVVLGHGRIGKTTLLSALENILNPTSPQHQQPEIVSTVGIDCKPLNLAGGEVMVWDFAGQLEYAATHQFFLSTEVICFFLFLILVDFHSHIHTDGGLLCLFRLFQTCPRTIETYFILA